MSETSTTTSGDRDWPATILGVLAWVAFALAAVMVIAVVASIITAAQGDEDAGVLIMIAVGWVAVFAAIGFGLRWLAGLVRRSRAG